MSVDIPLRKLTVAAGRVTIGFITEYSRRRFTAQLASGERIGASFPSLTDAALALSKAQNAQTPSSNGGAK